MDTKSPKVNDVEIRNLQGLLADANNREQVLQTKLGNLEKKFEEERVWRIEWQNKYNTCLQEKIEIQIRQTSYYHLLTIAIESIGFLSKRTS
jgi:tRNA A37 threonylcarbamoyladenosine biosynthesis protein TsaE